EFPISNYSAGLAISGDLLYDIDKPIYKEWTIGFSTLTTWLGIHGFDFSITFDPENPIYNLKYQNPKSISIELDDFTKMSFVLNSFIPSPSQVLDEGIKIPDSSNKCNG
ncbi:hypothetical protein, partial [Persicitalea sp.]|uniref:hypothetical protein n=1 Tax=Persicitalea sp. TaxID=3100273 RepID=UPI00359466D6